MYNVFAMSFTLVAISLNVYFPPSMPPTTSISSHASTASTACLFSSRLSAALGVARFSPLALSAALLFTNLRSMYSLKSSTDTASFSWALTSCSNARPRHTTRQRVRIMPVSGLTSLLPYMPSATASDSQLPMSFALHVL